MGLYQKFQRTMSEDSVINKILVKTLPPLLVIGAILVLYLFTDIFEKEPIVITPTPTPIIPSEYPDYEAFQSLQNRLVIVQDRDTYSPKNQPIIGRLIQQLTVSGEFSRIYIYIEASVDDGKPLTQWDSIYMTMNGVGGHLFRPNTLKVPGDTITKLLYGLNEVPIISLPYSEKKTPSAVNWFNQFVDGNVIRYDTFISSLRPGGKLKLIEIRYECEIDGGCEIR